MIDTLHIVTPVSRPNNLCWLADSIRDNLQNIPWDWWVVFDRAVTIPLKPDYQRIKYWEYGPDENSIGGFSLRNHVLDLIDSGWLYFLDDDNIIHPDLETTLLFSWKSYPSAQWFVFRQVRPDGSVYLHPQCPPRTNSIDIGQCVMRKDLIGQDGEPVGPWRFPPRRDADGVIFQEIAIKVKPVCVDVAATYYNALRYL